MNRGEQPKRLAAWLIFVYTIVFSVLGIDLAMALIAALVQPGVRRLLLHLGSVPGRRRMALHPATVDDPTPGPANCTISPS